MTASLYIHIPFCASKCAYCDFHSRALRQDAWEVDDYLVTLLSDINKKIRHGLNGASIVNIPTVYIGGGTPSFLGAERISRLLQFITKGGVDCALDKDAEITIEANPESVTEEFLKTCADFGVTRVSLGVQSFNDAVRKNAGRCGSGKTVKKKLDMTKSFFPRGTSCDLISGLPLQNEKVLLTDIERVIAGGAVHISLYDLITHGAFRPAISAEEKEALFLCGRQFLLQNGFEQYEVSNFALEKNYRSLHNVRYWRMENWLGAGESASGTLIDDDAGCGMREVDGNIEKLLQDALMKETFLMGFRFADGPSESLFKRRFKKEISDVIPESLDKWRRTGFVDPEKNALTGEGLLFTDAFLLDCFYELDSSAEN